MAVGVNRIRSWSMGSHRLAITGVIVVFSAGGYLLATGAVRSDRGAAAARDAALASRRAHSRPVPGERLIYAAARDVTDRRTAEEDIRHAQAALEASRDALQLLADEQPALRRVASSLLGAPRRPRCSMRSPPRRAACSTLRMRSCSATNAARRSPW